MSDEILLFSISKPYELSSWNENGEVLYNGMLTVEVLTSPSHTEKIINVYIEIDDMVVSMPKVLDINNPVLLRELQKELMKDFPKKDIKFIHMRFVKSLDDLEKGIEEVLAVNDDLSNTYRRYIKSYNILMNDIMCIYEDLGLPLHGWFLSNIDFPYPTENTPLGTLKDHLYVIKRNTHESKIKIQKHIKSYNEEYKELKKEVILLREENEKLKKEIELLKFKYEKKGTPKVMAEDIFKKFFRDKRYKKQKKENIIKVLTYLINESDYVDIDEIIKYTKIKSPQTIREICKLLKKEKIIETDRRGKKVFYRYILKESI